MIYELKMRLRDDSNQEAIASALEACAAQVRQMSSVAATHSMAVPMVARAVEWGTHGIVREEK